MAVVWLLDRATGLVSYAVLYLAVFTGIFFNAPRFGFLHEAAKRVHIDVSWLAVIVILGHALVGVLDTWLVLSGFSPMPSFGPTYLALGVLVGVGALLVLAVAVLGFVRARRFERPWSPVVVHAFAYAGFAFATIHAAAIGTDVLTFIRSGLVAGTAFLVFALCWRAFHRVRSDRPIPRADQ